jgi:hypothetical protein
MSGARTYDTIRSWNAESDVGHWPSACRAGYHEGVAG